MDGTFRVVDAFKVVKTINEPPGGKSYAMPSEPSTPSGFPGPTGHAPTSRAPGEARTVASLQISAGPGGFEAFCRECYGPMVKSLALALNNVDLGRDAASEALARAWQRWDQVSGMANPAGWVYRVGVNWGRSRMRKTRREVIMPLPVDPVAVDSTPGLDPRLAMALASLTDEHRSIVVAKYFLDWSEADIAESLKIPRGTVKSRLNRALDKLQTTLRNPS